MVTEDSKRLSKEFPFEIQTYVEKRSGLGISTQPHWHRFFEITYIEEGMAEYEVNGQVYEMKNGDIILFNHIETHRWNVISDEIRLIVLMFSSELVSDGSSLMDMDYLVPFLERESTFKNCIPHSELCTSVIKQLLDEIRAEDAHPKTGSRLMIKADILKILTILVRYYEQENQKSGFLTEKKEALKRIQEAFTFIKENYSEKITLERTAATVCMSASYFSGYFKKVAGCSFQEYLTKIRMERAKELLLHSDEGIAEIAQECGVSNMANFYRLYKKHYGVAPGEERHQGK